MKQFNFIIGIAVVVVLSFSACNKEEEEELYVPGPYSWDFGYINGKLNGVDINLQNEGGNIGKHISTTGAAYSEYPNEHASCYGINVPITKKQDASFIYGFTFHISPVKVGTYEVTKAKPDPLTNSIHFIDRRDAKEEKVYQPLKKPMKLRIDRADFSSESLMPFVEGEMEGILYNEENMNDSIIVENMKFGIHS